MFYQESHPSLRPADYHAKFSTLAQVAKMIKK